MPPFEGRCPKGGGLSAGNSFYADAFTIEGFLQPPCLILRCDCHRQSGMEIASLSPSKGGLVRCIIGGAARAADCRPYIF